MERILAKLGINNLFEENGHDREKVIFSLLFVFSVVFVTVFSYSTSFLYQYPYISDSHIFQVIGRDWTEGYLPYKDLFDNKGPILYGVNAIGYWLTGNQTGVYILQILFFFATSVLTFKLMRLGFRCLHAFILTVVLLFGLAYGYNSGNNAIEYAMPFIVASFYLFYKWLEREEASGRHPLGSSFFYGLTLGVCVMTRVVNGLGPFVIVVCLILYWAIRRQWKTLCCNLLMVFVGLLVVCIPFVVYFASHHALRDMYFSMVESNLFFLDNVGLLGSPMYLKRAIVLTLAFFNCLALLLIGFMMLRKSKNRLAAWTWTLMGVFSLTVFCTTNCMVNYAHACMPMACVGLLSLAAMRASGLRRWVRLFSSSMFFLIVAVSCVLGFYTLYKSPSEDSDMVAKSHVCYKKVMQILPDDERVSFVGYEMDPRVYLMEHIHPRYRFFAFQSYSLHHNDIVNQATVKEFTTGEAWWILLNSEREVDPEIKQFLKDYYEPLAHVIMEQTVFSLYRRK